MPENKKLLFLSDTKEALDYIPKRAFSTTNYPKRTNPGQHADFIRRKIQECQTQSGASATTLSPEQVAAIHYKEGMYIDLQNFTAEALREIKKIESCAMLLIPKNASDEWKNAYAKITIRNVASIIEVSYSKYSVLNGMVILNDKNVSDDCLYIVNGIIILETVEKIPDLCVNGLLLKRKKSRYEMTRMNGRSVEVEDNVVIKPYPNTIEIDGDTVRSFDYNTLVAAGNNVDIVDDVTEQMLSDKKITFAAGNEVKCGKNILGYVKVNSTVGNKITEKNE